MLVKIYANRAQRRRGTVLEKSWTPGLSQLPETPPSLISTSHIERQNLTMHAAKEVYAPNKRIF